LQEVLTNLTKANIMQTYLAKVKKEGCT